MSHQNTLYYYTRDILPDFQYFKFQIFEWNAQKLRLTVFESWWSQFIAVMSMIISTSYFSFRFTRLRQNLDPENDIQETSICGLWMIGDYILFIFTLVVVLHGDTLADFSTLLLSLCKLCGTGKLATY